MTKYTREPFQAALITRSEVSKRSRLDSIHKHYQFIKVIGYGQFGTVREAIKSLSDAGYLVSRRGRYGGTFLAEDLPAPRAGRRFDRADIDDTLRLREILEVGAARMAAGRTLTAAERETLWNRLADVRGADPEDYRRLDSRLHLAIAEAAGAPSLVPLVAENRMRLNELLDHIPLLTRNIVHSDEQHVAIVLAILAGDADGAAETMTAHVWGSASLLHGFLDD